MHVDIIIPCLNESNFLPSTLQALIHHCAAQQVIPTIIVVDNGSTDDSRRIAEDHGALVIVAPDDTIGALRNRGVAHSTHDIVVFLDADMEITPDWVSALKQFASEDKIHRQRTITGARCLCPENATLLQKSWFGAAAQHNRAEVAYINSGNLITTRHFFKQLSGFNTTLTTGEDYEFCQRGARAGGHILADAAFKAYHHGYPESLAAFFTRELWHGCGDFEAWATFRQSKPARVGILLLLITLGCFFSLFWLPLGAIAIIYLVSLFSAGALLAYRHRPELRPLPINTGIGIVYLYARGLSLSLVLLKRYAPRLMPAAWRWR